MKRAGDSQGVFRDVFLADAEGLGEALDGELVAGLFVEHHSHVVEDVADGEGILFGFLAEGEGGGVVFQQSGVVVLPCAQAPEGEVQIQMP